MKCAREGGVPGVWSVLGREGVPGVWSVYSSRQELFSGYLYIPIGE